MGLLRPAIQSRRAGLLRPTPRRRRPASSSIARPGQPPRRDPAWMPPPPQHLRRTHRLGAPPTRHSRLTPYEPGMSNPANAVTLHAVALTLLTHLRHKRFRRRDVLV